MKLLIANRGEIAIRIAGAAADLGLASVAVYSRDDAASRHRLAADEAVELDGVGPAAYLDAERVVAVAGDTGCDTVHPGYGLLSEDPAFAERCIAAGLRWVGPPPRVLSQLGDKVRARELAASIGVPVVPGRADVRSAADAEAFFAGLGGAPMMIKAVAGGGGTRTARRRTSRRRRRRVRAVPLRSRERLRPRRLFVERFLASVRHIEVQILGDGHDVTHLWERECSIQRRHQKLIEAAPAPRLASSVRDRLIDAAVAVGRACGYSSLGTVDFSSTPPSQLRIAARATLQDLGLDPVNVPAPRGVALQLRVNAEIVDDAGSVHPAGGLLRSFEPPSGRNIRVDTYGYAGYATNPSFDSLLAKVVVRAPDGNLATAVRTAERAMAEFRVEGIDTNIGLLRAILARPETASWDLDTRFVESHMGVLLEQRMTLDAVRFFPAAASVEAAESDRYVDAPLGSVPVPAPLYGVVVSIDVEPGAQVHAGQDVGVLEALKMQHVVVSPISGVVTAIAAHVGDLVEEGQPILFAAVGATKTRSWSTGSCRSPVSPGTALSPSCARCPRPTG